MIGPIQKKFLGKAMEKAQDFSVSDMQFNSLPSYISYKASLIKEKATLKIVLGIVTALFAVQYISSRHEVALLETKLREKEYILAPGLVDFTTVSPQAVPEGYVNDAVNDFVTDLGNINPQNAQSQYSAVKRFMDPKLRVKFEMETTDWLKQVEADNLSQIFTVSEKEITADKEGNYKAVVLGRADFYANHQYLGYENQVIEMHLRLTSPQNGKRWYLEMTTLKWDKADTFKTKRNLQGEPSTRIGTPETPKGQK